MNQNPFPAFLPSAAQLLTNDLPFPILRFSNMERTSSHWAVVGIGAAHTHDTSRHTLNRKSMNANSFLQQDTLFFLLFQGGTRMGGGEEAEESDEDPEEGTGLE